MYAARQGLTVGEAKVVALVVAALAVTDVNCIMATLLSELSPIRANSSR